MHDDVNFLQLLLQYLKILLSCANYCLYYLNLVGINKFKYERKRKWILEVAVKWFVIYSILSKHRNQLTKLTIMRKTINGPIMSTNVN